MTDQLSDDEDPMATAGGGAGMDDEEDEDLGAELDPRGGIARQGGSVPRRPRQQQVPYDDDENF
jgi:hypothetical protein